MGELKQRFHKYHLVKNGIGYSVDLDAEPYEITSHHVYSFDFSVTEFDTEERYVIYVRLTDILCAEKSKKGTELTVIAVRALFNLLGTSERSVTLASHFPPEYLKFDKVDVEETRSQIVHYAQQRHDVLFDEHFRVIEFISVLHVNPKALVRQLQYWNDDGLLRFERTAGVWGTSSKSKWDDYIFQRMLLDKERLRSALFATEQASRSTDSKPDGPLRAFISYSTKDKHLAGQIHKVLENKGIKPFLAHENIEGSEEWMATILGELDQCHIFVALLTENYRKSEWADHEAGYADARGIRLFPLIVDGDPHGFLGRIQGIQLDPDNVKPACEKIVAKVRKDEKLGPLLSKSQPKQTT